MDIRALISERFGGATFGIDTGEYKFGKIKTAKEAAMAANPDLPIIDMGIGEPDGMADQRIIDQLYAEAKKYENRVYADNSGVAFKTAAGNYIKNRIGVDGIDSVTEISHAVGSKNVFAFLPAAFINSDDYALVTSPGYPVLGFHTEWMGGKIYELPLKEENHFLPDLKAVPEEIAQKAKLLYLNYPNNPTGAVATVDFYKEAIAFAKQHNIVIVADAAYIDLAFDQKPLSFLSVDGAKEVGIEVYSMSKSFNMTGWRLAFVAGNRLVLDLFKHAKDNYDSGQFLAIQNAAIFGLENPSITEDIKNKYYRRHESLVTILKKHGFDAKIPGGTFYLYLKTPKGVKDGPRFNSGEDFCQFMIRKLHISTVPWDEQGNFIRFSVTFETGNTTEAAVFKELDRRLSEVTFEF